MNAVYISPSLLTPGDLRRAALSAGAVTLMAVVLVGLIAWVDYSTGDFSMDVFYLVPVALTTWYAGRGMGFAMAALSALAWLVGDMALRSRNSDAFLPYWNAAMPALVYSVVVYLLSALQQLKRDLEHRVEQRTFSLAIAQEKLHAARLRLIEADKLETVGRLAVGIAHEVKNPLMTITMAADYLAQTIPACDSEGTIMVNDMRDAVERANRVLGELLEYGKPGELHRVPHDFHEILDRTLGLMKIELVRKHITVEQDRCDKPPVLPLDRNKMEQVLVNMTLNAIQAMGEHGILTITTDFDDVSLTIRILDTGTGISPEHKSRIFQPFFTTKPVGVGTGLGLSVARRIVQMHGGTLNLANRPEGGACVTIKIPVSPPAENHNQPQSNP